MYIPLREGPDNCFFASSSMKLYNPLFGAAGDCGKSRSSEMSTAGRISINCTLVPHCAHVGKRSPLKIVAAWLERGRHSVTANMPDFWTSPPDSNDWLDLDRSSLPLVT